MSFEVRGADDFLRLSKALKNAGRTGKGSLRNELHAGMRNAVRPLLPKAQQALAQGLPGELSRRGAKTKQVVKLKTGRDAGLTVGVQFGGRGAGLGASNARLANRSGEIRHPLFGDRGRWYSTSASGSQGWFDNTYSQAAPHIRGEVEKAMARVVEKIIAEAR